MILDGVQTYFLQCLTSSITMLFVIELKIACSVYFP